MLFNPVHDRQVRASDRADQYAALEREFVAAHANRKRATDALVRVRQNQDLAGEAAAVHVFLESDRRLIEIRERATTLVKSVTGDEGYNDVNYVFPMFITTQLPVGLVGIMIAAIFAAAMSSISSELNSLSTSTVIDFYRRHFNKVATDRHYLQASKVATGFWGVFACVTALFVTNLGSLIEVVNRFGSFFYGSLLGVFVLALGVRRATATGAFWGLVGGMVTVTTVAATTSISYLWLNLVGAVAVFAVGRLISRSTSLKA